MDRSDNRHSQFDILSLAKRQQLDTPEESGGLQKLDVTGHSLSRYAPSRKRPRTSQDNVLEAPSGTAGVSYLRASQESPWNKYKKVYELELGGTVEVAVRRAPPVELVHIRTFSKLAAKKALHMIQRLRHRNIVAALDAFSTDQGLYVAFEHMSISLDWVVKSPAYPNEKQLAAIIRQVLYAVSYLTSVGFEHGSLCCSNILLSNEGVVKIAHQDHCQVVGQSQQGCRDLRALSFIMMELMQKYIKEDGVVGIDDLDRWHPNSDAVAFLSATTSAASTEELLRHPLMNHLPQKEAFIGESLIGLISLAQVCTRGHYQYTPEI